MIGAIAGGKGGVGKSTTALNLAAELEAVVVDADLTTADLPRGRGPDLHDVLAEEAAPLDAVETIGGIDVLSCGRSLEGARAADLEQLRPALRSLDRRYDHVLVDCPAGLARDVGIQLRCADLVVLVTTPTKAALLDAVRTRRLATAVETPIAHVVLNKTPERVPESFVGDVESTFGAPATVVERATVLDRSGRESTPVRELDPEADPLSAIERVSQHLRRCERRIDPGGATT